MLPEVALNAYWARREVLKASVASGRHLALVETATFEYGRARRHGTETEKHCRFMGVVGGWLAAPVTCQMKIKFKYGNSQFKNYRPD